MSYGYYLMAKMKGYNRLGKGLLIVGCQCFKGFAEGQAEGPGSNQGD